MPDGVDRLREQAGKAFHVPPHRRFRGGAVALADGIDKGAMLGERGLRPALTFSIVAPASFQANWLSPRSPKDMQTIFIL